MYRCGYNWLTRLWCWWSSPTSKVCESHQWTRGVDELVPPTKCLIIWRLTVSKCVCSEIYSIFLSSRPGLQILPSEQTCQHLNSYDIYFRNISFYKHFTNIESLPRFYNFEDLGFKIFGIPLSNNWMLIEKVLNFGWKDNSKFSVDCFDRNSQFHDWLQIGFSGDCFENKNLLWLDQTGSEQKMIRFWPTTSPWTPQPSPARPACHYFVWVVTTFLTTDCRASRRNQNTSGASETFRSHPTLPHGVLTGSLGQKVNVIPKMSLLLWWWQLPDPVC